MYLKRIEMQGFKSFADKTVLEFKPGITTVIGPNGSGKSNISDAIRWVLGEQSMKSLRGAKSEDIIFAGTQARKSLGFAEVSIVIDNNDNKLPIEYSEVTVTRKIYRSGETGYFINKVPCRLKDILELFMDTGIGKDGYSIIGQGKIDEILSNKSEDRRHIFEEAAGIVKYRTRKQESEKKLEQTKLNLLRINDILAEIEAKPKLKQEFYSWEKKYRKEFLDFCTGVKGVKIMYDFISKEILNPETVPERVEELLSLLIGQQVHIKEVLPNDGTRISDESTLVIMDMVVELEDGSIVNLEVQKIGYKFPGARSACYSADLLLRQYKKVRSKKGKKFNYTDVKDVYTIVLFEKSPTEFHEFPDTYIHYFEQHSNTGIQLNLLQKYLFISIDIFLKYQQNIGIQLETRRDAWLAFMGSDDPDIILKVIEKYPDFKEMYQQVYEICQNIEEVMGMFSKELAEMDRNTAQLMIDEMQEDIKQKEEILKGQDDRIKDQINKLKEQDDRLKEQDDRLKEQDDRLKEQDQVIRELMKKIEQLENK